jgi:molybdopterin biosynthesis enzyme MoaB
VKSLLLVVLLATGGCVTAPPNLTPQATAAFYENRVRGALDQVRDVAQAAAAQTPPLVSQRTANDITRWHRAAIVSMHAATANWQAGVLTSLEELIATLPQRDAALVRPYVALARTVLMEIH